MLGDLASVARREDHHAGQLAKVVEADAQDPAACERIRAAKGYPTSGAIVPARTLEQSKFH